MFPRQTTTPHLYSWVTALLKLNNTVQCIRGMMGGGGGMGWEGCLRKFGFISWVDNVNWPPQRVSIKLMFQTLSLCHLC